MADESFIPFLQSTLFSVSNRDTTEQQYRSLLENDRVQQFLRRNGLVSDLMRIRCVHLMLFDRRAMAVLLFGKKRWRDDCDSSMSETHLI